MSQLNFQTPKGTTLPLLDLRGKPYLQVPHRIVWFREEHPDWVFVVSYPQLTNDHAMARAEILDASGVVRAVAHKVEHKAHFQDFAEKAETSAIGRALAMIGYGTQFAPEFEEGDRLADSPTDQAKQPPKHLAGKGPQPAQAVTKPVEAAKTNPPTPKPGIDPENYVIQCGKKYKGKALWELGPSNVESYMNYFLDGADKSGKELSGSVAEFVAAAQIYLNAYPMKQNLDDETVPF